MKAALLALAFLTSGCSSLESKSCAGYYAYNMTFQVKDQAGAPVCGIEVVLEKDGTARRLEEFPALDGDASCDGKNTFGEQQPGTYKVTIQKPGYKPTSFDLTVTHSDGCHADAIDRQVTLEKP
jgi:hypothetical protein